MKLKWPHRLQASLALVLILCVSSACKGSTASGPEVAEGPLEVGLGTGSFDLADTTVGLAGLSSYKATLIVAFDGTQDGQPQHWSSTFEMTRTREPWAGQLSVQGTGIASQGEPELPEFMAEVDGASYERLAQGGCSAAVAGSGNSLMDMLEPAAQLRTVFGATPAGHESVNGIEADKYTFDERGLARKGLGESTGEMWISSAGGYIVRYVLTAKGDQDFFGQGIEGSMAWDYELSEVNQVAAIQLPADCPAGMVNAPTLPDAANIINTPGLLQYETASSVADVLAFYTQELPKLGWAVPDPSEDAIPEGMSAEEYQQMLDDLEALGLSQPTATPNPNQASVTFQNGSIQLDVIITRGATSTTVRLVLSRLPA